MQQPDQITRSQTRGAQHYKLTARWNSWQQSDRHRHLFFPPISTACLIAKCKTNKKKKNLPIQHPTKHLKRLREVDWSKLGFQLLCQSFCMPSVSLTSSPLSLSGCFAVKRGLQCTAVLLHASNWRRNHTKAVSFSLTSLFPLLYLVFPYTLNSFSLSLS